MHLFSHGAIHLCTHGIIHRFMASKMNIVSRIPTPTHPNEVGILEGVGGHRLGYNGFGFCFLFLDWTLYPRFKEHYKTSALYPNL